METSRRVAKPPLWWRLARVRRSSLNEGEARGYRLRFVSASQCSLMTHTSELQSRLHLVCRLLLEKKKRPQLRQLHAIHIARTVLLQRVTHDSSRRQVSDLRQLD